MALDFVVVGVANPSTAAIEEIVKTAMGARRRVIFESFRVLMDVLSRATVGIDRDGNALFRGSSCSFARSCGTKQAAALSRRVDLPPKNWVTIANDYKYLMHAAIVHTCIEEQRKVSYVQRYD